MGIRVGRPSPAMVVAVVALIAALTGTAFAALGKNTVGTKQLKKNAVTAAKIKKNAVTTAKLKNNAVSTAKLQNNAVTTDKLAAGAVTGAKIQGAVPNATNAANAANLAGQQSFFVRLNGGQTQTIATHGSVSVIAACDQNVGGLDSVKLIAQTTQNGAILNGLDALAGPGINAFLEPETPAASRELLSLSDTTGQISVFRQIDSGYVLGPDGKMITLNSEGVALGLNYGGSVCLIAGVLNLVG